MSANALELTGNAAAGRNTTWCSDCRSVPVPMEYINNPQGRCGECQEAAA